MRTNVIRNRRRLAALFAAALASSCPHRDRTSTRRRWPSGVPRHAIGLPDRAGHHRPAASTLRNLLPGLAQECRRPTGHDRDLPRSRGRREHHPVVGCRSERLPDSHGHRPNRRGGRGIIGQGGPQRHRPAIGNGPARRPARPIRCSASVRATCVRRSWSDRAADPARPCRCRDQGAGSCRRC